MSLVMQNICPQHTEMWGPQGFDRPSECCLRIQKQTYDQIEKRLWRRFVNTILEIVYIFFNEIF